MIPVTTYHASRHLADGELEPEQAGCPWCGSVEREAFWRLQDAPVVDVLSCRSCEAASASRMPKAETLAAYYARYYDDAGAGQPHVTVGDSARMARRIAAWVGGIVGGEAIRIVDFGGGDGTIGVLLAEHLRRARIVRSARVTVVDLDDRLVSPRDPHVVVDHARELEGLAPGGVDVVMASGVLEHIPAGRATLDALLARVRVGGAFYARTPQMASFFRVAGRLGLPLDFTFPGHVHDLGQGFWEGLFRAPRTSFEIVASEPSLVEASLREHPLRAIASHAFKLPWRVLGRRWGFVGGWEIVARRRTREAPHEAAP